MPGALIGALGYESQERKRRKEGKYEALRGKEGS